jgi:Fe-S cluster assembly ATP-binding protein
LESEFDALNLQSLRKRELNSGFSGGELKRSEILKLYAQAPDLFLLDEPESGVDLENISIISEAINQMLQTNAPMSQRYKSALIITHTGYILNQLDADAGHVMIDGKIICSGNPRRIFNAIKRVGYEGSVSCASDEERE